MLEMVERRNVVHCLTNGKGAVQDKEIRNQPNDIDP